MALIWRFGEAFTAIDDGDGPPVCIGPGETPPRFSETERWVRLTWAIDGWFDERLHIVGRVQGRAVIDLYLHAREFDHPRAMAIVEAIRQVLSPLPALSGEPRRHQWVETPDSVPLDRCSRGHHVWPPGAHRDDDYCYCGQRHLREARRVS